MDKEGKLDQLRYAFEESRLAVRTEAEMELVDDIVYKMQQDLAEVTGSTRGQKMSQIIEFVRYFFQNPNQIPKTSVYVRKQEAPKNIKVIPIYEQLLNPLQIDVWCFDASRKRSSNLA